MPEIIISTETGSDLPEAIQQKYGFRYIVPMHVSMGDEFLPDASFPVDRIYEYFDQTGKVPSTSAVNTSEYEELFSRINAEHPGCIIFHLAYSGGASATFNHACVAAKNFSNVYPVDTKSVSGGATAFMIRAHKMIHERIQTTDDYAAIADELQALADRVACCFIPGKLDFLKAGGRVSNAAYLGASLLNLKPLIELKDGVLVATKKYRGSMEKIVDGFMKEYVDRHDPERDCLYLMYSKGASEQLLNRMAENALNFGFESYTYVMTGCVVSSHSGRGAIGLSSIRKK